MALPSTQAVLGNAAGGFLYLITTTLVQRFHSSQTAAGRAQAVSELYEALVKRHKEFSENIFPLLPKEKQMTFANLDNETKTLIA